MTDSKKGSYIGTLARIDELLATPNNPSIIEEAAAHLKTLNKLLKLVNSQNIVEKKREALKEDMQTLKIKKQGLNSVCKQFDVRLKELSQQSTNSLFNSKGTTVNVHRVLEHHSIILPFISVPEDYRLNDQFLPWSFGTNKAELFEIEASSLNYKYKQNRSYKKLGVPNIVYLNHSEKNITKFEKLNPFSAKLKVNNFLYVQASISTGEAEGISANQIKPFVLYTLDGSDPTRFNHAEGSPELIYISKSCVLKLRAFKPEYMESNMLVMDIDVEARNEDTVKFALESMLRPEFEASDNNSIDIEDEGLSDMAEDIFVNENFASWHDYGTYSTPKD